MMAEGGEDAELSKDLLAGSDCGCDFQCHPCSLEGAVVESSGFCVTCDEYLCGECFRHHKKISALRHHVLLDSDAMPKDPSKRKSVDVCTDSCETHNGKVVEYYCPEHDLFGCSVCMTMNHKSCDIQYIPDVANDVVESGELKNLQENACTIGVKVREHFKTNAEKSKSCASEAVKAFNDIKKKLTYKLDLAEKQMTKDIDGMLADDANRMASASETIESELNHVESMLKQCELLSNNQQTCKLFVLTKHVRKRIHMLADGFENTEKDIVSTKYAFAPTRQVRQVLNNTQLVGRIQKRTCYEEARKTRALRATYATDKELCWITGFALLSPSRIVAVDRGNCRLKMLHVDQNKVTAVCDLPSPPRDITKLLHNQVAIACGKDDSGEIVFVDTVNDLAVNKIIKVNGLCCGIARANDKLILSYPDIGRIDTLTMEGETEKTFNFDFPFYIYVDCNRDVLYVTNPGDGGNPSVTSLTMSGTTIAKYTECVCLGPVDVKMDSYGSLYVCCWKSENIHMLNGSLKKERVLLTSNDRLYQPYSICINEDKDDLYVGMRGKDYIRVYHLS